MLWRCEETLFAWTIGSSRVEIRTFDGRITKENASEINPTNITTEKYMGGRGRGQVVKLLIRSGRPVVDPKNERISTDAYIPNDKYNLSI